MSSKLDVVEDRLLTDPRYYVESLMSIRTETKGVQPFKFNFVQRKYWEARTTRDIILKSRRIGFTSEKLGEGLTRTITNEGFVSLIVCHTPASATSVFEALKIMFFSIDKEFRPKVGYDNRYELSFPDLSSKISVTSAGKDQSAAEAIGRGGAINFLHCSEFAFWPLPKVSLTAVLPCVPADGFISIETTANGFNEFYRRWKLAKSGTDVFKAHFFPWFCDPKCRLRLSDGQAEMLLSKDHPLRLTREEQHLIKLYGLSLEQIKWRRFKINEIGADAFPQEYPCDDRECFLQSGRPFFNATAVQEQIDTNVLTPAHRWPTGELVPNGWRVFKPFMRGRQYVGGVDCAEGLEVSDFDSISILDRETGEEVIHIYGIFGPVALARQVALAHRICREMAGTDLFWGIERNNHGHTCISTLIEIECLPKRYIYRHAAYDDSLKRRVSRPGWSTDQKSRPIMLDELKEAISKQYTVIHDADKLQEFLNFVVANGKPQAQSGATDDSVMSHAIAWQMRKHRPFQQIGW
jgi:hypothetical protein